MDSWHRTTQIINLLMAVVLVVAIGVTAYSINRVRTLESEAKGKPTKTTTDTSADSSSTCASFVSWEGTIKKGKTTEYTAKFCGGSEADLLAALNWRNANNKLSLTVTDPNGKVTTVTQSATQSYVVFAQANPLPSGSWKFTVKSVSGSNVKFSLWARFD